MRARIRSLVDAAWFKRLIIVLILVNGVTLGLETWPEVLAEHGPALRALDRALLWTFVAEIALRLYAYRRGFFRDPWNLFDLVVIGIALLPATGPFAVLRVFRVLRVLRLLSAVPSLRMVVTGLFRALPGMASISLLLALLLYVAGVVATKLFQHDSPQHFGDLWTSLFTLFQIMTGDSWSTIARDVMEHQPYAWTFFIVYILISTFIALNLFIAVAVEALEHGSDRTREQGAEDRGDQEGRKDPGGGAPSAVVPAPARPVDDEVLAELRALRGEVAELRRALPR
ncbi:ion transporter [Nocardiopsis potens]|uniref:ion transporter n=1 Tax=Nocardiopsis potens TaxID=1246458 RepID=UPI0003457D07|nr:ion transporter [Nocardiopsis potens]